MTRAQPKARAARPAPVPVERAASDPDQGLQQAWDAAANGDIGAMGIQGTYVG